MKKKLTMDEYCRMYPEARKRITDMIANRTIEGLEEKIRERKRRAPAKPVTKPRRAPRGKERGGEPARRW